MLSYRQSCDRALRPRMIVTGPHYECRGFPIGLVSKILPISSQAGGKMVLINVGIEVSRGVRRQKFSEMANCSNVDVTMMS